MMTGFFRIIAAHSGEINRKSLLTGKIRLRKSSELPFHPCGGVKGHIFTPGTGCDCTPMKMIDPVGTRNQGMNVVAPK